MMGGDQEQSWEKVFDNNTASSNPDGTQNCTKQPAERPILIDTLNDSQKSVTDSDDGSASNPSAASTKARDSGSASRANTTNLDVSKFAEGSAKELVRLAAIKHRTEKIDEKVEKALKKQGDALEKIDKKLAKATGRAEKSLERQRKAIEQDIEALNKRNETLIKEQEITEEQKKQNKVNLTFFGIFVSLVVVVGIILSF